MKELKGYKEAKVMTGGVPQLPKGGYIGKILKCTEEESESGYRWLNIQFDIAEGEHKDHFKQVWNADTNEDKKWKGRYNAFIPDETSMYYEDNLSQFKTMMANIEESNSGYKWDWDEKKLKGKAVGLLFGEKEIVTKEGKVITITECRGIRSVECIKEGKFKMPQLKAIDGDRKPAPATNTSASDLVELDDDDDLPF